MWAVLPAAGVGVRFGAEIPKQYLRLAGRTVVEWALRPLLARADIRGVVVALSPSDQWWAELGLDDERIRTAPGGDHRAGSVRNALRSIERVARADDWVLVHDAVRPCLTDGDLDRLVTAVIEDGAGGILASLLQDTVKRSKNEHVDRTLDRKGLWRALTPQMFRYGALLAALESGKALDADMTDESAAMERVGVMARLVEGRADNIKVTRPEDLPLAEFVINNSGIG
jgi:2-C-methyl-D-erythritol 4-phosphate cytidylyltransferase